MADGHRGRRLRRVGDLLVLAGAVLLGVWSAAVVGRDVAQRRLAGRLADDAAAALHSNRFRPVPPHPAQGAIVGAIDVPRIGISAVVLEGVDDDVLDKAVGHIPGTAVPGRPGNVALAGHRDSFFRDLRRIRAGDTVDLSDRYGRSRRYRVTSTDVVSPADTDVLAAGARDRLTLVTCYPFSWVGPAPQRFVVRAAPETGPSGESARRSARMALR